jgi:hypothetical protein
MILTEDQIKQFIDTPFSGKLLQTAVLQHRKLDMHVNGNNVIEYIQQINGFENEEQLKLRQKTLISNKHIFASIIRIINKIYSAKGGSTYYELPETQQKEFIDILNNIKGIPLRKWIQNKGLNKYLVDPNGVFLIEHKMIGGQRYCYPTYKEVTVIHDYQRTGRKLEYLILKEGDVYRVYDDSWDKLYKKEGDKITDLNQSFGNPWGEVPGILIGDKFHDTLDIYESRFQIAVELADKYLLTNSIKNVYEFAHGFPLMWRLLTARCPECNGTGKIDGVIHKKCKGTGFYLTKDVSDVIGVFPPKSESDPKLVPDIAGYVQPDLETWREYRTELEWLDKLIQYSTLGSYVKEISQGKETATSVFVDAQPVNDSLNDYADWSEDTEKLLTDFMGKFYFGKLYENCSVNLGRRYMIEKPDELWKKYLESRAQGAPVEKLDDDIIEYYESKYANDTKTLEIQKKLFYSNEYRHLTIDEAKSLPPDEFYKWVFHSPWVATLDEKTIKENTYDQLRSLKQIFITKNKPNGTTKVQ